MRSPWSSVRPMVCRRRGSTIWKCTPSRSPRTTMRALPPASRRTSPTSQLALATSSRLGRLTAGWSVELTLTCQTPGRSGPISKRPSAPVAYTVDDSCSREGRDASVLERLAVGSEHAAANGDALGGGAFDRQCDGTRGRIDAHAALRLDAAAAQFGRERAFARAVGDREPAVLVAAVHAPPVAATDGVRADAHALDRLAGLVEHLADELPSARQRQPAARGFARVGAHDALGLAELVVLGSQCHIADGEPGQLELTGGVGSRAPVLEILPGADLDLGILGRRSVGAVHDAPHRGAGLQLQSQRHVGVRDHFTRPAERGEAAARAPAPAGCPKARRWRENVRRRRCAPAPAAGRRRRVRR